MFHSMELKTMHRITTFRFRIKKQEHGPGNFASNRGLGLVSCQTARKGDLLLLSEQAFVIKKYLKPFFKSNSFFMMTSNLFKKNDYTMLLNCVTATSSSTVEKHNVKLVVHTAKHIFDNFNYVVPSGNYACIIAVEDICDQDYLLLNEYKGKDLPYGSTQYLVAQKEAWAKFYQCKQGLKVGESMCYKCFAKKPKRKKARSIFNLHHGDVCTPYIWNYFPPKQ